MNRHLENYYSGDWAWNNYISLKLFNSIKYVLDFTYYSRPF